MAVEASATFVYHMFRGDFASALGVDGYFTGFGQVTGDGTGGHARVTLREGTDGQYATRALMVLNAYAQKSATIGDGVLQVIGKAGSNQQTDHESIELDGVGPYTGTLITYHPRDSGSIGSVLRSRGWFLPSFEPGTQDLLLDFYFPNDAGATVWTCKCYGYYMFVRLS